jgi:predicted DNA-binding transcriptional regulator YafY
VVTLRVRNERDVVQWLLGWGRHVRVLEPESLRTIMVQEAEQILRNHGAVPVDTLGYS